MNDHSQTALEVLFLKDLDPQDRIAPNFRVYELDQSEVAARLSIDTRLPDDATLRAAVRVARELLQPIREAFAQPFSPLSVYRSQELERVLKRRVPGWISTSPHTAGYACDLRLPGIATLDLARWAMDHLPDCDEILCESFDPAQGPQAGWLHIALRPSGLPPRPRQVQTQLRAPRTGRWIVLDGLRERID